MVEKTRVKQMKERGFIKTFICAMILKGDFKGYQETFKTFFGYCPL